MKFCSSCGHGVTLRIPEDDNLPRFICDHCDTIHYQNPNIVTGCLPVIGDKVLLCKRAIEPRHGYWTLPAGFMENSETLEDAAMRESAEEAYANVELEQLYTVFSLPHVNQVYILFRARLLDETFKPGIESLEVKLFSEDEIPWDNLAFRTIYHTLKYFFGDRKTGQYTMRSHLIEPAPK
ncbi:MutT/Nudix family protein [hydrothermal vent metagenome]|uniref:MutT/Nudix family protein n=1 Tax=hydrothermal vent metagenome TaxID=652676 RepID=A0A3B0ZZF1_9ZZZZ